MAKTNKRIIKSAPFLPNRGIELAYVKKLKSLCKPMIKEYQRAIMDFYRSNKAEFAFDSPVDFIMDILSGLSEKYIPFFDFYSKKLAIFMVLAYGDYVEKTFASRVQNIVPAAMQNRNLIINQKLNEILTEAEVEYSIEKISETIAENVINTETPSFVINAKPISSDIADAMQVAIMENVSLIKSIAPQYIERVTGAVTRAMQNGMSDVELGREIAKYGKMTLRRAVNIAQDQSRKSYTALTLRKMERAGIKKFQWIHVGGSIHPREHHLKEYPHGLNNGIFDIDNPPVIDKRTGERGFPAQLPFCRCTMAGVSEFD